MSVVYSTVRFKKDSNHGTVASRIDDVIYDEVKLTRSDPPPKRDRNRPAVSVSRENAGPTSYPYRLTAGCLGLLCVLLLTVIIALCVRYSEDHSNIRSALANKIKFLRNCFYQSGEMVCPKGWRLEASKCYYISTDRKNWTESRNYCTLRGADLVIMESERKR
ncbi:hypothetical protein AAFF_G00313060 [Aldrovandia affinis]|uniref:Uncharacterized protein n=1 Tax=Aldrovandia affinis TaxID=143900 RepID=A0AAD7WRP3_9TELE|nr:hypothetical protein AAFF_G00313060 [Aldrovandia affinis]